MWFAELRVGVVWAPAVYQAFGAECFQGRALLSQPSRGAGYARVMRMTQGPTETRVCEPDSPGACVLGKLRSRS